MTFHTHVTSPPPSQPRADHAGNRLLITAGPTHEPIDAVRFIGNRSSGRLGVSLADAAAGRGWHVTLLLGPTSITPSDSRVRVIRFRTTADLAALLESNFPNADMLVMAAAVADFRPKYTNGASESPPGKLKRTEAGLTLELESTPDLLAACSKTRRPEQRIIGFALEPRERLLASAAAKVERKGLDLIVANPLETMDGPTIEATLLSPAGVVDRTHGPVSKEAFAAWLLDRLPSPTPAIGGS